MKKIVAWFVLLSLLSGGLVYTGDYLVWRLRLATGHNPYSTVTVQFYFAIGEKNGKTEYDFQPPQSETCVNSLIAHQGSPPCWYERRHPEKAIRI
jgi:hypothetical protein